MKCDICKKNNATIHLTEIINNKITEIHVCQKCAKEKGIEAEKINTIFNVSDLFTSLIPEKDTNIQEDAAKKILLKCSFCNMTYNEFKRRGKFGCAQCYESFKEHIAPLIRRIHGSQQHLGKVPINIGQKIKSKYSEIKKLKTELMESIKQEQYEKAAILRDKIKEISSSEIL